MAPPIAGIRTTENPAPLLIDSIMDRTWRNEYNWLYSEFAVWQVAIAQLLRFSRHCRRLSRQRRLLRHVCPRPQSFHAVITDRSGEKSSLRVHLRAGDPVSLSGAGPLSPPRRRAFSITRAIRGGTPCSTDSPLCFSPPRCARPRSPPRRNIPTGR